MLINLLFQKQIKNNRYRQKKIQSPIILSPIIQYPYLLKHYYKFYVDEKAIKSLKKHEIFILKNKLKTIIE